MKIAVITDNFKTISAHFGRAAYYQIFTIENNIIVNVESRPKTNHNHFERQERHHDGGAKMHGMDTFSQGKHRTMLDVISDCQILLARGMGNGAYLSAQERDIEPIITDRHNIQDAVSAYLQGSLENHKERLH